MSWSPDQQRMLGAMGYELLERGSARPAAAPGAAAAPVAAAGTTREAARPGPAKADAVATAPFTALRLALRRAAGDQDISTLVDDLERLRREPALKRALWPRLRALRRSH